MTDSADIAALKARVDGMESDIAEIKGDVKAVRSKTDKWSGIVGLAMLSVPALLGAAAGWLLHK